MPSSSQAWFPSAGFDHPRVAVGESAGEAALEQMRWLDEVVVDGDERVVARRRVGVSSGRGL